VTPLFISEDVTGIIGQASSALGFTKVAAGSNGSNLFLLTFTSADGTVSPTFGRVGTPVAIGRCVTGLVMMGIRYSTNGIPGAGSLVDGIGMICGTA